jgi:hydrogenase expression/formation protein HypE
MSSNDEIGPVVKRGHGGGGALTQDLFEHMFLTAFDNAALRDRHDGARLAVGGARLAFATDSHVVYPLFFPGGDIGTLSVNGTANDLAMCGAKPLYLSAGFILEEGLPLSTLNRVVQSMRRAANEAGMQIVTGDTKVVERGKGDGVYVNTAGIGLIETAREIVPRSVRPGDAVLVSGDIGRHGIAVIAAREGLALPQPVESDCAPLYGLVQTLLANDVDVHCLRDATRGGLAAVLVEIAQAAAVHVEIEESSIPVSAAVGEACELIGLDPLSVANEGRMVAFVAGEDALRALDLLRAHPLGAGASIIGRTSAEGAGGVTLRRRSGGSRLVRMFGGEELPRIC